MATPPFTKLTRFILRRFAQAPGRDDASVFVQDRQRGPVTAQLDQALPEANRRYQAQESVGTVRVRVIFALPGRPVFEAELSDRLGKLKRDPLGRKVLLGLLQAVAGILLVVAAEADGIGDRSRIRLEGNPLLRRRESTLKLDLNGRIDLGRRFDVVTNRALFTSTHPGSDS
jgi:hypothetical protein